MTEENIDNKSSNINFILIAVVSSIIGGILVYHLLKPRLTTDQTFSFASANNSLQIENRLINIEQKLQQLQIQSPIAQPIVSSQQTNAQSNTYKNKEIRNYIRDNKGRITSTKIIRNAKIS